MMYAKEIKIGDLFYTSWGYDQTNYDYIIIIGLSASKKTATCQRAKLAENTPEGQCNRQKPSHEGYGKPFKMCIKAAQWNTDKGFYLRGSYPFCYDNDDSKRLGIFWKCEEGEVFYETDTQFGH